MKRKTLVYGVILAVFVLSPLLSACTPAQTEVTEEAPAAPEATVVQAVTVEPTAEPTPEPPDYVALFTAATADINPRNRYLNYPPSTLALQLFNKSSFVLDVREDSEIKAVGYIEDSVHIPVRDLMKNLDKLPALDESIVVISASGHQAGFVLAALKMMGYTNVHNLDGGMAAWIEDDRPVVTGSSEAPAAISTPIIENQQLWTALDAWFSSLPDGFYSITSDDLNTSLAGGAPPVFIDVRTADEQALEGYLKGAVNIPLPEFMATLDQLPSDKAAPVVVYCASGFRGAVAAMAMRLLGYTNVVNLAGGLNAWKAAQPPLEFYVGWLPYTPLPELLAGGLVRCPDEPHSFYLVGGIMQGYTSNRLYRYDIDTGSWESLANLPTATSGAGLACYQGNIYVAGGADELIYDMLQIYNIAEDQWSNGTALPEPTWGVGLGAWDGKLYLVGGNRGADYFAPESQVDVYDIATKTWTAGGGANMPTASSFYSSVQVGSYLYIVGGFSGDFNNNVNQTQRYDLSTDTWDVGPTFTSARGVGALVVTSSHLYMLGGDLNGGGFTDATGVVDVLDLTTWPEGEWVTGVPLPAANLYLASTCTETLIGGEIWDVGGANPMDVGVLFDEVYYLPIDDTCSDE